MSRELERPPDKAAPRSMAVDNAAQGIPGIQQNAPTILRLSIPPAKGGTRRRCDTCGIPFVPRRAWFRDCPKCFHGRRAAYAIAIARSYLKAGGT